MAHNSLTLFVEQLGSFHKMSRYQPTWTYLGFLCIIALSAGAEDSTTQKPKNADADDCGRIDELFLNDIHYLAAPTEHPWIGRILYNKTDEELTNLECLAVLITPRNLLAPAHCFLHYYYQSDAYSMQFGVWNKSADLNEWNCDLEGYCVPPAKIYKIEDIALHPNYDTITFNNDIAVLTIAEDVKISNYIQPVCGRPLSLVNESLVGQHFYMAGFQINKDQKRKTAVRTISLDFCKSSHSGDLQIVTNSQVCGYQEDPDYYDVGSPLMGAYIHDNKYQYFYLVGFLIEANKSPKMKMLSTFVDVSKYREWIKQNVH